MMKFLLVCTLMILTNVASVFSAEVQIPNPDGYPAPVPLSAAEEAELGKLMPRTMHLLASSTATNKKKVKIAIYGQSLSDGNNTWWVTLRDALKETYPNADIEVNCLGIGGCSAATLWYATMSDILTYYPDLVIFHVLGHHVYYDHILRFIRGCTTAEMLIQGDHFGRNDGTGTGCGWSFNLDNMSNWENKMSFEYVKGYCDTYGLERNNRRKEWYDYLKENCYVPSSETLLKDDIHFAEQGNYLAAALAARHFKYDETADHDPRGLVKTYSAGTDFTVVDNAINLTIDGNRVDIITENCVGVEVIETLIDNKKPSQFPGCYNSARSNNIWNGYLTAFAPSADMQEEIWTLDFFDGYFTCTGSETGYDGEGDVNERFVSESGRIVIDPGAFWASWDPKSSLNGKTRTFTTKLYGKDTYTLPVTQTGVNENLVTLAQGFPNGTHQLTLTGAVAKVKEIRVYKPPFQLTMTTAKTAFDCEDQPASEEITIASNTYWQACSNAKWIKIEGADNNNSGGGFTGSQKLTFSVTENATGRARSATVTINGVGVEPISLTINQTSIELPLYKINVENGVASFDSGIENEKITISATPPAEGMIFNGWTGDVETVADVTKLITTFIMPGREVNLVASFSEYVSIDGASAKPVVYTTPGAIVIDNNEGGNAYAIYSVSGLQLFGGNSLASGTTSYPVASGMYIVKVAGQVVKVVVR